MFLSNTRWKGNALQNVSGEILFSNDINWLILIWSMLPIPIWLDTGFALTFSIISNCTWSQSSPLRLMIFTSTSCPCSLFATAYIFFLLLKRIEKKEMSKTCDFNNHLCITLHYYIISTIFSYSFFHLFNNNPLFKLHPVCGSI